MNERLHELIEETVAIYMKRNLNGTVPQRDYLFQEIFTELIVRECQTVVEWAISVDSAIDRVPVLIKEHFGIKE
jgi:hypothetical protein